MKICLVKVEMQGIKNISEKITLDFANKTINKKSMNFAKVKAIYGGNGCGKSAIINSMYLYMKLVTDRNFLAQNKAQFNLSNLINKNCSQIYFKMYYSLIDEKKKDLNLYSHELVLQKDNSEFYIAKEKFSSYVGRTITEENERPYYLIESGELKYVREESLFDLLLNKTKNLLKLSTLISDYDILLVIAKEYLKSNVENKNDSKTSNKIFTFLTEYSGLYAFTHSIYVKLETEEQQTMNRVSLIEPNIADKKIEDMKMLHFQNSFIFESNDSDLVNKKNYKEYEKEIERLADFIKIFMPDLNKIIIDRKVDCDNYHCDKILSYYDYDIDAIYESTGIKKLIELFPYISAAVEGGIVFIDEFDANINGVFLNKLIEFMLKENFGQLCFTSHNLEPLTLLKSKPHSIDFLSACGEIVPWTNCGNYSARRLYLEGMIKGSPFNFDYFDFYPIFNTKEGNK